MTLLLDDADLAMLIEPAEAVVSLRDAIAEQAAGRAQLPDRQTTDVAGSPNWLRISSAFLSGRDLMGFKSMNRAEGTGMRYLIGLYRISSGELLALMDADRITTQRTAATSTLGTDLLAPAHHTTVGIIGSGVQADAFIRTYASVRPLERAVVFSPREESRQRFAATISDELGIAAEAVETPEKVVTASETVVLAMRAPSEPVLDARWLRRGQHVTGLSSVRWNAREIDDATWARADVVVADDRGTVFQSGDGISAVDSGAVRADDVPELWELVDGRCGRRDDDQVTLFKSAGNALQDLAIAGGVYHRAAAEGRGRDLGGFPHVKPYA